MRGLLMKQLYYYTLHPFDVSSDALEKRMTDL